MCACMHICLHMCCMDARVVYCVFLQGGVCGCVVYMRVVCH